MVVGQCCLFFALFVFFRFGEEMQGGRMAVDGGRRESSRAYGSALVTGRFGGME